MKSTQATYKWVGISTNAGETAVRYANQKGRARHLERVGHTNVQFVELEQAERVEDCISALLDQAWVTTDPAILEVVNRAATRVGFVV